MILKSNEKDTTLLILSHTLMGIGFYYLNVFHTATVFENKYNFSHLSRVEREMLFTSEHGLYFNYYKTVIEADTFSIGLGKILNDNMTEYPSTINAIQHFDIYPEIFIGYLYKQFQNITATLGIKTMWCWGHDTSANEPPIYCDGIGEPIAFYIEFTRVFAGLFVFLLYMFGTYLNRNFFGGIATIVYFFIINNDSTLTHTKPAARENFSFPFILWQIFYLTISIERFDYYDYYGKTKNLRFYQRNYTMIIKQTILTTLSVLFWQFSSIIFATQVVIVFVLQLLHIIKQQFIVDYAISQILTNLLLFYLKYYNKYYLITVHNITAVTLLICSSKFLLQSHVRVPSLGGHFNTENNNTSTNNSNTNNNSSLSSYTKKFRLIINDLFLFVLIVSTIYDSLFQLNYFSNYNLYNKNLNYLYILLLNLNLIKLNYFNLLLYKIDANYNLININTIKLYNNVFFIKFFSLFIIIYLGRLIHKKRYNNKNKITTNNSKHNKNHRIEINSNNKNNDDNNSGENSAAAATTAVDSKHERIKNYLLEDFLEENHIKLNEIKNYEKYLNNEINIIKTQYNYNYNLYKLNKAKNFNNNSIIIKNNDKMMFLNDIKKLREQIKNKNSNSNNENGSSPTNSSNNKDDQAAAAAAAQTDTNDSDNATLNNENVTAADEDEEPTNTDGKKATPPVAPTQLICPHYLYAITQTLLIFVMSGIVLKLKYIATPFLCLISATFPSKKWFYKNNFVYWFTLIILLMCGITDPGIENIKKQYTRNYYEANTKLEEMLQWITMNTNPTDVFGGPYDVTSTILVVCRRPIVNHAHHELPDMEYRTKLVYSIFSRKQSSEIYNNLANLKVQYVVLPYNDCFLPTATGATITSIWDVVDPENKNNSPFCSDLYQKLNPSFLIVFANDKYLIIKIFSQRIELELNSNNYILEYSM